ncbi:hypothetical protein BKA57DRAFT_213034 [Linnemannia elongata]|nr:hypothetical protein BKA57DRAFT_213034 [Linnemannia elongata]
MFLFVYCTAVCGCVSSSTYLEYLPGFLSLGCCFYYRLYWTIHLLQWVNWCDISGEYSSIKTKKKKKKKKLTSELSGHNPVQVVNERVGGERASPLLPPRDNYTYAGCFSPPAATVPSLSSLLIVPLPCPSCSLAWTRIPGLSTVHFSQCALPGEH